MAGGKRGPSKKKQITAETTNFKGKLQQPFEKHRPEKNQANGPAEGTDRKRKSQSSYEELHMSPQKKRARVSPSAHQSTVSTTTLPRDSVKDTSLHGTAHAPTPSTPNGNKVSLTKDINSRRRDPCIPFGRLRQLGHPRVFWDLRMENDRTESQSILMGSDRKEAKMLVFGLGVGGSHCLLTFELRVRRNGSLRRRVVVQTIRAPISSPSLMTRIWVDDEEFQVEDKMVLPPGAILQLGDGERYVYDGPEFASLYSQGTNLYGHDRKDLNSNVMRVQRISDKRPFVAKIIARSHIRMAKTEIQVFETLGRHPYIVQFVEAIYDPRSQTHHLVLEAGFTDLWRYIAQMRPHAQDVLRSYAPQWINEITSGIKHIHDHGISHRDIKPRNILVFVSEIGRVEMKIADMGLARRHTRPVKKQWFAGSPYWYAPASFMAPYQDPKLVDCYGVGRVLFVLLTAHPWPEESQDPQKVCGCTEECQRLCAKRQTAFQAIDDIGIGDKCLDFLKHLLVERPEKCYNASEMLGHAYITDGIANKE